MYIYIYISIRIFKCKSFLLQICWGVGLKILQSDGDVKVMVEKIKMKSHSVVQVLQSYGDVKVQFSTLSFECFNLVL